MAYSRLLLLSAALAASVVEAQPPNGPLAGIFSVHDQTYTPRHCNYYLSVNQMEDGDEDFMFTIVNALNGNANARSIQSVNYPTYYFSIVNASTGALGIDDNPNKDDASWLFTNGLAPCPKGATDCYSIQSMTQGAFKNQYMTWSNEYHAPCEYSPPNGDLMLTTGAGYDPSYLTWLVGPLPPASPINITVNTATVINSNVNKRFMGCHHDYGFAQAPRGYYANLLYGANFDQGTIAVPSWTSRNTNGANGGTSVATAESFSSKPSMQFDYQTPAPNGGGQVGMVNRGIGYAGFALSGNQPYFVELWVWSGGQTTGFVQLNDYTTNTTLARTDFTIESTGPDWGSTWIHYNFTLTPSASTTCTPIAFGSDPNIDCGGDAGPAHVCVRCGGEFYVGLSAPGNAKIGYVSMTPGSWGLLQDKQGKDLPVLKAGADSLKEMGVTLMRSGGSVSQSMRWQDWRGPAWKRPSLTQIWGESLLAGWGPFDVIDMCNALDIEPVITLAYDTNDALDFADLVEYCWGDATTTTWGQRRAADGHPLPYNVTVFELGNEQYNPFFPQQVAAMEARAKAIGAPPLHYMFPQNQGLNAADAATILANNPDAVPRIFPDLHVGAGGAVESAAGYFANPPVPGFNSGAINCETNAGTHDHARGLAEASDLLDWFTYNTSVTDRLYARTASFCSGTSAQFDSWDQGIAFFIQGLPNGVQFWYQSPGYVHIMITNTWAETTVQAVQTGGNIPFAAQRTADGTQLVLRAVSAAQEQPFTVTFNGVKAVGPSFTLWTLSGSPAADNTPSNTTIIAPVQATVPITAGSTSISYTLQPHTFAIMVIPVQ